MPIDPTTLEAALRRADQAFDKQGHLNIQLGAGERVVADAKQGIIGFSGPDYAILAVDTNHNGTLTDPSDRVIVAAQGMVFTADTRGNNPKVIEDPALSASLRAATRGMSIDGASTTNLGQLTSSIIARTNKSTREL